VGRAALFLILITAAAGTAGIAAGGQIELISRAYHVPTYGAPATLPSMSADGRYVVFASNAPDLVPGQVDRNNAPDLFLRDRAAGITTLITHANGSPATTASYADARAFVEGRISADGRYVVFESAAVDLIPERIETGSRNVFLWDRATGSTTLVSHAAGRPAAAADGSSSPVAISADGSDVVFASSADDLLEGRTGISGADGRANTNLFLWRRSADTLTLLSARNGSPSVPANGSSWAAAISADGAFVAFLSEATDLVPGFAPASPGGNVFLYDRSAGTVSPLTATGGALGAVFLSADGRWIAFTRVGSERKDAFLYDRGSGETRLVSHRGGSPGIGVGVGSWMAMSADGGAVAFTSAAPDLVAGQRDANGREDLFVYDRESGETSLVTHVPGSPATAPADPGEIELRSLSADGRFLAYRAGQGQIFLYDRASGSAVLASHSRDSLTRAARGESSYPLVSEDGGTVLFQSPAPDLGDGAVEPNGYDGLFVYDRLSREVSPLAPPDPDLSSLTPDGASSMGDLSADGRLVAFVSEAGGVTPGQVQGQGRGWNVFLRDRETGETRLISRPEGGVSPVLSADGGFVAFVTLPDATGASGLILRQLTGTTEPVLVNHGPRNARRILGTAREPAISADGRYLAYACRGCSREPGDAVFLYDRVTGAGTLVSRGTGAAGSPRISADGRFVVFLGGKPSKVFLFDRTTGAVNLVALVANDASGAGISADGRWIFFRSANDRRTDLFLYDRIAGRATRVGHAVPEDDAVSISADGHWLVYLGDGGKVFLYDRVAGASSLVSHAAGSPATAANRPAESPRISADGRRIAFLSAATDLMSNQTGGEGIGRAARGPWSAGSARPALPPGPSRARSPAFPGSPPTAARSPSPRMPRISSPETTTAPGTSTSTRRRNKGPFRPLFLSYFPFPAFSRSAAAPPPPRPRCRR
jgi:Tol biopolymer transport system component